MATPSFETLLYSVEDGIATITLNRPDKMNAFTAQMMLEMIAAFDETDADDAVKAVIVTGSGQRAFCAGADLSSGGQTFDYAARGESAREEAKVGDVYRDGGGRVTLRIFDSLKPVICAVNGAAVGIGVTMQLAMDIRIASTEARFGFVFARRESRRRPPRPGSCHASSASPPPWNGAIPAGCSLPPRRTSAAWSVRCTRRTNCFPPPARSSARSSTTPPRSRWP